MSVRYNEDFKKEVVKAYMAGDRSLVRLSADYNVAKSTISDWAKKYG
ncbi:MAG: helix-turn-helix domain-containing protein [Lachnospiraceae bacterium]|nr:helix-turn-helix domain-containing protein [Lachnospiraceae bacterium]